MDFGQLEILKGVVNIRLIDADELERDVWDSGIANRDEFSYLIRTSKTVENQEAVDEIYPLKPCPFCGGRATWTFKNVKEICYVHIICDLCGCQTKLFRDYDDQFLKNPKNKAFTKAEKTWNRREFD